MTEEQLQDQEIIANFRRRQNEFNIIKHRTDTSPLLLEFEKYLSGGRTAFIEDKKGNVMEIKISDGLPKANQSGIQTIMKRMNCIINPHTLQGNFPLLTKAYSEAYECYCQDCEVDLATDLMINMADYEIPENEYQGILNSAMASIKPIMSRCIDNKERESYSETTKSTENFSEKQKPGILKELMK